MSSVIDPIYEDFLKTLLRELEGGDLNRQMLLHYIGAGEPRVKEACSKAIDDLVKRRWIKLSEIDYLSITEEGRKQLG